MSINVVVSSTAAGVSVSGGTSVAIAVSGGNTAAISVGGGIGPAGFIINPGTATNAFGTFQLTAGDGITISTSAAQFQIASYGTTAVSSLAPVQSVAGRVGNVTLQAGDVTAGTFAVARIPTISYTALANVPTSFAPSAHTHGTADIASFSGSFAVAGHTHAASAITSGVLELARIPTIGYTALSGVPATFAPQAHTHSTADITGITASFASASHTHGYVQVINGLTGTVSIAGGAGVTVSTSSSSITIAAAGGGSANIVEATTVASFPAVGSSSTLYVATDASRGYRFDASGFYVEIGPGGVRGDLVPTAPEITSLSISGTGVQVGWTASSTPATLPVLNYILQYATLTGSTLSAWSTVVRSTSAATSVSVLSLADGSTYKFRVCGVNAVGQGPWSATSGSLAVQGMRLQYVARYATGSSPASYSTTGLGTGASPMVAYMTGGSEPGDTRLWLSVLMSGTLSYTVTASCEDGYDGGRLFLTGTAQPGQHSYGGFYDATGADIFPANQSTYANVSPAVTGSGSVSGTVSVTAGQYLVLRWAKYSEGPNEGTDRITATLSIS